MSFIVAESGDNYEKPEAGSVGAVCLGIIDLGTQRGEYLGTPTCKKEMMILFELAETMQDGRPFVVNKRYTVSLNEKSNLRKDLTCWRAKEFTAEELQGFDVTNIIGKPCMVSISLTEKGYARITGIMPLPKGMESKPLVNEQINFTMEQIGNAEVVAKIYPWVQKIIADSDEGRKFGFIAAEKQQQGSEPATRYNEAEEVPF